MIVQPPVRQFRFRQAFESIDTPGIDFGGKVTILYQSSSRAVFRKAPGKCWCGRGIPAQYVPAELWLVETGDEEGGSRIATIVLAVQPGKTHKWWTGYLIDLCRHNVKMPPQPY